MKNAHFELVAFFVYAVPSYSLLFHTRSLVLVFIYCSFPSFVKIYGARGDYFLFFCLGQLIIAASCELRKRSDRKQFSRRSRQLAGPTAVAGENLLLAAGCWLLGVGWQAGSGKWLLFQPGFSFSQAGSGPVCRGLGAHRA